MKGRSSFPHHHLLLAQFAYLMWVVQESHALFQFVHQLILLHLTPVKVLKPVQRRPGYFLKHRYPRQSRRSNQSMVYSGHTKLYRKRNQPGKHHFLPQLFYHLPRQYAYTNPHGCRCQTNGYKSVTANVDDWVRCSRWYLWKPEWFSQEYQHKLWIVCS